MSDIERDRWRRPLCPSPLPDGPLKPHRRPSSIGMKIADRFNLERWAERMVAKGIADRPDLQALAHTADTATPEGKRTLDQVARDAKEAARASTGSNLGTALHRYVDNINKGLLDVAPLEAHRPAIDAYRRLIDLHQIDVVHAEQFVVCNELEAAGTTDILAVIGDNGLCVADLKTGQSNPADWSMVEYACQLACYGNATHTWDGTTATPLPDINRDVAFIIWVPSGSDVAELIEVDIAKGRRWVELALEVDAAQKDRTAAKVVTLLTAPSSSGGGEKQPLPNGSPPPTQGSPTQKAEPVQDRAEWLYQAIRDAAPATRKLIAEDWPHNTPLPKEWGHRPPSTGQLARVERVYDAAASETGEPLLPPPRAPHPRRHTAEHPDPSTSEEERRAKREGPPLTDSQHAELVTVIKRLPVEHADRLAAWAAEANQAGYSLSVRDGATTRQATIIYAATALVDLDDEAVRCALAAADKPDTPIGRLLSGLTIDQAARLPIVLGFPGTKEVLPGDPDDPDSVDLVGRYPLEAGK